jgi:hypothetical protein
VFVTPADGTPRRVSKRTGVLDHGTGRRLHLLPRVRRARPK